MDIISYGFGAYGISSHWANQSSAFWFNAFWCLIKASGYEDADGAILTA